LHRPVAPPDSLRRTARELAARAQEAAIVADNATARELYGRAAQLDPTDPTAAYALGRVYEEARDARAITEYCRFLLLAPDAAEAPDVRRRIAALSYDLVPPASSARTAAAGIRRPSPKPGQAFSYGVLFPGLGQYYTRRPLLGMAITALTAGAVYYALQTRTVATPVTRTATDPFGNPYQYQDVVSHTKRPHAAAGVSTAVGISLVAAIEAFAHARSVTRANAP